MMRNKKGMVIKKQRVLPEGRAEGLQIADWGRRKRLIRMPKSGICGSMGVGP